MHLETEGLAKTVGMQADVERKNGWVSNSLFNRNCRAFIYEEPFEKQFGEHSSYCNPR